MYTHKTQNYLTCRTTKCYFIANLQAPEPVSQEYDTLTTTITPDRNFLIKSGLIQYAHIGLHNAHKPFWRNWKPIRRVWGTNQMHFETIATFLGRVLDQIVIMLRKVSGTCHKIVNGFIVFHLRGRFMAQIAKWNCYQKEREFQSSTKKFMGFY